MPLEKFFNLARDKKRNVNYLRLSNCETSKFVVVGQIYAAFLLVYNERKEPPFEMTDALLVQPQNLIKRISGKCLQQFLTEQLPYHAHTGLLII